MRLAFDQSMFLWLLALVPLIWFYGLRQRDSLGAVRSFVNAGLRTLVLLALILALAGVQANWRSDRVTVIYLLDQSDSIDPQTKRQMREFVVRNVQKHRDQRRMDRAGVIVFGKEPAIEVPPYEADLPQLSQQGVIDLRTDATDLEAALKLATSSFSGDSVQRLVLVTDGNQTSGEAKHAALRAVNAGIGIDVVPVSLGAHSDVIVEQMDIPGSIRVGQPFETRIVVSYHSKGIPDAVTGQLTVLQIEAGTKSLIVNQSIALSQGKSVFPFTHQIDHPGAYTFEAQFVPDHPESDYFLENNRVSAFSRIQGKSRILFIEPWNETGTSDSLINQLREEQIEVVVQPSNATFTSMAELQGYDCVVLGNVPRTTGDSIDTLSHFSDEQIEMLWQNTHHLGAGLLLLGGPDALGAGGWTGTKLETMMPVDFEVKNTVVNAVGALMLVMDSSGSMDGDKINLCKLAAREAVKALGAQDYVGVLTFDSTTHEIVPMQQVADRGHIIQRLSKIGAGGGTDLMPTMKRAFQDLAKTPASVKHMIVLTDGQTTPGDFQGLTQRIRDAGITVTSVAIGQGADVQLMSNISTLGGGKFYHVLSPQAIPRILMRETRRVTRPLIIENKQGIAVQVKQPQHPIMVGVSPAPPITGYVLSTPKQNPLVQELLTASGLSKTESPLLSVWQYGLGRTAVLTTDGGPRWSHQWMQWSENQKLMSQLMRWLMRPAGDTKNFSLATKVRDQRLELVVDALDQESNFLNFLEVRASVLDPDLKPQVLALQQTSPGRYTGQAPIDRAGTYLVQVFPGQGSAPLFTGITIPYGLEYRDHESNWELLTQLASMKPGPGTPGVLTAPINEQMEGPLANNPYRSGLEPIVSVQEVWPWMALLASLIFLADCAARRIRIDLASWLGSKQETKKHSNGMTAIQKLKNARSEAAGATAKGLARYEPAITFEEPSSATHLEPAEKSRPIEQELEKILARERLLSPDESETSKTYTERLLDAKRRAHREPPRDR